MKRALLRIGKAALAVFGAAWALNEIRGAFVAGAFVVSGGAHQAVQGVAGVITQAALRLH